MQHESDDVKSAKEFVANLVRSEAAKNGNARSDGRRCALACIDILLSDEDNIQHLYDALQVEFDARPVDFLRDLVMPSSKKLLDETDTEKTSGPTVILKLPDNGRGPRQ